MDPQPYVERLYEDEGLTADLDDAPAQQLLEWLSTKVEHAVESLDDADQADRVAHDWRTRGRQMAQLVALVDEGSRDRAQTLFAKLYPHSSFDQLSAPDASGCLKQLLLWEDESGDQGR